MNCRGGRLASAPVPAPPSPVPRSPALPSLAPRSLAPRSPAPQLSFDELGTPLRDVTFVVLDLETTGGSAQRDAITEVGAVKVRGGERLGELATLVDPGTGIPPQVVALTGITTALVTGAPRLPQVLPSVLEFLTGAVLVAHNAPFDAGFLRAACERHGATWPRPPVLCTARLARAVLSRDEAPSVKLGALAELFGTGTRPTHRALADARATVDVLHHLLGQIGNLGVQSLEELLALVRDASARCRRRRGSTCSAAPGTRCSTWAPAAICAAGCAATSRRANGVDASGTWSRRPSGSTRWCVRTRWKRRSVSCA